MKTAVVIPAYKAEDFIERAVKAAFEQTVVPDEVIVSLDGPDPRVAELAASCGARVIEVPKSNANVARNAAIRSSSADLILMCDADDWFMPGKIEAHVQAHKSGSWALVFDPGTWIAPSGETKGLSSRLIGRKVKYTDFTCRSFWYGGSTYSFKRAAALEIGLFREELTSQQDLDFWVRLGYHNGLSYALDKSYTNYYMNPRSVSRNPQRVVENMRTLLGGLPFLPYWYRRRFWCHVMFTAAEHSSASAGFGLLITCLDKFYDPRFGKSLFSIALIRNARNEYRSS